MASQHFINWVERQSQKLRRKAGIGSLDILDPYKLAAVMGVPVITPYEIIGLSPAAIHQLLEIDPNGWSAGAMPFPDGHSVVLMNPTHSATRRRATLMEELSYIYLEHGTSQIVVANGGISFRSYKKSHETEAYWVGAAALLPRDLMLYAQRSRMGRTGLADFCGVSSQLVGFRENITTIKLH